MHSSLETYDKVPAFLYKLWKLVEDKSTDHLIRWQEDGKSFILYKQGQFSRELLPQYYKHNNMASFVRQLNMYGFRKVPSMEGGGLRLDRDEMEFAHPNFIRGQEQQLEYIKRKMTSGRVLGVGGGADDSRMVELMSDVTALHRKQETLITQMNGLRRENAEVWSRYCDIDQKLQMQNNIIEKLTRFVVSVLKPKGLNLSNVRRLPQLQALLAGHGMVPALTQGSNRSPLSDGPVIHEVVDDVFSTNDSDETVTLPTHPLHLTNALQQQHLPTTTEVHPVLSPVTTTITERSGGPSSGSNSRLMSLAGVPSDVYTVVGGSGAQVELQLQQQQHLIADSGGMEEEDVYITPDNEHLTSVESTLGMSTSNADASANFVDSFDDPVPVSQITVLAVNSNPIVESPRGSRLSDGESGVVNSGLQAASGNHAPMMVTFAGCNTNNSSAVSSNAAIFVGDNFRPTPSSFGQTVKENFISNDPKLRRGVSQFKTNSSTVSSSHNVSSGYNSRGPSTVTFTVGPNNTLIHKNTRVVLNSSDPSGFTTVPIKPEIVLGAPMITVAPSNTTTTTAPFLTRTGKQQHIVTNVSVIPNSNRVSITKISNSGNKGMGGGSSGKQQAVFTNLEDRAIQDAIITDTNLFSTKRGIQNNRISGGKKQILVKNNNNASSSTGNNFNNTISTMGNIVSSISTSMPTVNSQSVNSAVKRARGSSPSTSSFDSGVSAGGGVAAVPVFKVVRKTPSQLQASQQQANQLEVDAAASELVAAAADLLLPSTSTDVVPLSNNVGKGASRGQAVSEPPASACSLDLASGRDPSAGASSDVALSSSSGQAYTSRDDMSKQMEDVQTMLDNLQDLFQSGQLERDQNALFSHIFNPDFPLSDFETMTGFDMSPTDQTGGDSGDSSLQQQLALYNPPGAQDLTALLDSPNRPYLVADDDQPFAMASLDPDLINATNVQSRTPARKRMRTATPVKKEHDAEDEEGLDPSLAGLYSQGYI